MPAAAIIPDILLSLYRPMGWKR